MTWWTGLMVFATIVAKSSIDIVALEYGNQFVIPDIAFVIIAGLCLFGAIMVDMCNLVMSSRRLKG